MSVQAQEDMVEAGDKWLGSKGDGGGRKQAVVIAWTWFGQETSD